MNSRRCWVGLIPCVLLFMMVALPHTARAQDLLNDDPQYSPFNLELRPFATLPTNSKNIISMTTRSGDARLYVSTQEGQIYVIDQDANGSTTPADSYWPQASDISPEELLSHMRRAPKCKVRSHVERSSCQALFQQCDEVLQRRKLELPPHRRGGSYKPFVRRRHL